MCTGPTEAELPPTELPPLPEFRRLDPRVVRLWRTTGAITALIILIALAIAALVSGLSGVVAGTAAWILVGVGWCTIAAPLVWFVWSYPPRAYEEWGYRIDARVLETRSGVVFRVTRLLPLPRLQHVDLQRGPLERGFGLASLILHTAGTHEATITIPGLDGNEAVYLRDTLVKVGGDDAV